MRAIRTRNVYPAAQLVVTDRRTCHDAVVVRRQKSTHGHLWGAGIGTPLCYRREVASGSGLRQESARYHQRLVSRLISASGSSQAVIGRLPQAPAQSAVDLPSLTPIFGLNMLA